MLLQHLFYIIRLKLERKELIPPHIRIVAPVGEEFQGAEREVFAPVSDLRVGGVPAVLARRRLKGLRVRGERQFMGESVNAAQTTAPLSSAVIKLSTFF